MELWNNKVEMLFFQEALRNFASREQLFYNVAGNWYAYVPKSSKTEGQTLQCRNSLIGKFTEKWCKDLFAPVASELGLFAVNGVICEEIGLSPNSNADLAFCTTGAVKQEAKNIKLLFEIKMSVVSNYELSATNVLKQVGNYTTHRGTPSLLHSNSMLKAISKAINIRVSGYNAAGIPIVVLGNSPTTESYKHKVDFLKKAGVVQGFWNLSSEEQLENAITETPAKGFQSIRSTDTIYALCSELIDKEMWYFSGMLSKKDLGKIIRLSSDEPDEVKRAEKFLKLIEGVYDES